MLALKDWIDVAFKLGGYYLFSFLSLTPSSLTSVQKQKTLRYLICSEFFFLEMAVMIEIMWFFLVLGPEAAASWKIGFTLSSFKNKYDYWSSSHIVQPYVAGVYMFVFCLELFFSLKVTPLFRSFTKLSVRSLLTWLVFTSLLLFAGILYFSTLLSQS